MNKGLEQTRKNTKSNDRIGDQKANLYHFQSQFFRPEQCVLKYLRHPKEENMN